MSCLRIIPRLEIKGPDLVKGVQLEGLRVLGNPMQFAQKYYEEGADELIYLDMVASLYGRNSLLEFISNTARKLFIPLTIGGGIRTIRDIEDVLRSGADRVAINSAALRNPDFINSASSTFGATTIVISIEAMQQKDGSYLALADAGREPTNKSVVDWAIEVEARGAGEILLTSVDREGTRKGMDVELISQVTKHVTIPVIVHGGAASCEDILLAVKHPNVSGIALSSMLHYNLLNKLSDGVQTSGLVGNTEFLKRSQLSTLYSSDQDIRSIKNYLSTKRIPVRQNV